MAHPNSLLAKPATILALLTATSVLPGQVHSRDEFVRGQPAQLRFQALPTISFGVVAFSLTGTGQGPCAPALGICLGVLDPIVFSGAIPSDLFGNASLDLRIAPGTQMFQVGTQGLWVDLTSATTGLITTNAVGGFVETLAAWDQSFDNDALDPAWQFDRTALFSHQFTGGKLVLSPNGSGLGFAWNDDSVGGRIFRAVDGDFLVCSQVQALDPTAPAQAPPLPPHRLGGLLLRDPASTAGARDWMAIGIGSGSFAVQHAITAIDTQGATSSFTEVDQSGALNPTATELQIERSGETITCRFRNGSGSPFVTLATFSRTGLPLRLEIGMFATSAEGATSVTIAFDDLRFEN